MPPFQLPIETSYGRFMARYSIGGLIGLEFPADKRSGKIGATAPSAQIYEWHRLTTVALEQVLVAKKPKALPPFDLTGTAFQKSVWAAMQTIAHGKTVTYGELAAIVGNPRASQAIGSACGANPIPVLIPCHRVLAANGRLGGFSAGLPWKKILLSIEGSWRESQTDSLSLNLDLTHA